MMCYRDMTFCGGDGCQRFGECPRSLTKEVDRAATQANRLIARFTNPQELDCYVAKNGEVPSKKPEGTQS